MARSIDVAQVIYNRLGWVDAWCLQKLTYYVQAWSLGWYGHSIIEDEFQAWKDGPVEPKLFRENRYGRASQHATTLPNANVGALSEPELALIDAVLCFYGTFSAETLIKRTHAEGPWLVARAGLEPQDPATVPISQHEMKKHYALAEARGEEGPVRPFISPRDYQPEEVEQLLEASRVRWEKALAILADR